MKRRSSERGSLRSSRAPVQLARQCTKPIDAASLSHVSIEFEPIWQRAVSKIEDEQENY